MGEMRELTGLLMANCFELCVVFPCTVLLNTQM